MKKLKQNQNQTHLLNPFDHLSEELMFKILDHLLDDPFAAKSFSLTCKSFVFLESRHRKSLKPFRTELLLRLLRRYPSISHLDLTLCPRVDDSLLNLLSSSLNHSSFLSLNLSRSRFFTGRGLSALISACVGLLELDLSNATDLTDAAAPAIAQAKALERLNLGRCKLFTDIGIGCIAVGCRKLKLLCLKWCVRVGDLGVELIALKCKDIRSLDLSYLPITEKCLSLVLQLPQLEDLGLEGCLGLDDDGLSTLVSSSKSLKTLNVSNCQNVTHIGLSSLTKDAVSLEHLNFSHTCSSSPRSSKVTADLASCLGNFSNLQSVKLDGCLVSCSGLKTLGNRSAGLKELSLSKCNGVTDEALSLVVQSNRELRRLNITCCRKITYESLDAITGLCSSLVSLRMESCSSVPKEAFGLIGQRCPYLEELDVTDNEVDNEGLKAIGQCSRLSSLKLGICCNIDDTGLEFITSGCRMLKELDLYRCLGITDKGIEAISSSCHGLEMVNMAYNERITDGSLISLSRCPRLKVVEVRGCSTVSSRGLSSLANGCRQLTVLDIKKCVNVDDRGMLSLAECSQNLRQINLSYCGVTDVGVVALASLNRLQNMTILHVFGLSPSGLAAALLSSQGLNKVKLHSSFRSLLPPSLLRFLESRGCVFHWRAKPFQV
ncbi:PREDICTED: F-box/LRR-repeat protein 3-like [Tarenaya hassleriana]|uniref:F-box/LRR-repeat protein 3-like n=1 Tax=Tarenaya hassleriana TaxID=28532 RepID=UPI00053C5079|nr:PREDICTED: F-box/LRR-repeat protein 3-like [Tarenaya hassleriana]